MDPFSDDRAESGQGFDVAQIVRSFWRRRLLFLIPFLICLFAVVLVINLVTPVYLSTAQLRVVYEATPASVLPSEMGRYNPREMDREALINIETIVTGPKFLERVAQDWQQRLAEGGPGVSPDPTERLDADLPVGEEVARMARRLRRMIHVGQDGPHLFSIGVRDTDPVRAYYLARLVLDLFLEEERASRLRPSTSTRDFLERQRSEYEADLADAERRLTEFQQSMLNESLAGNPINEGNLGHFESVLARLRAQLYEGESSDLYTSERVARGILPSLPSVDELSREAEVAAAMRDLANLEYESLLGARDLEGEGDRQDRLGALRLRLNRAVEAAVARQHPELGLTDRGRVAAYLYQQLYREVRRRVMARLQKDLDEYRQFVTRQPEQSSTLARLRQDAERARQLLSDIDRSITQENLRIEASLSEIGYKMVVRDDPVVPGFPVAPDRLRLLFMGLFLALALGAGLVVLAEIMDRSFKTVDQIERELGLPVIGALPVVQSPFFRRPRRRLLWAWSLLAVALVIAALVWLGLGPRPG